MMIIKSFSLASGALTAKMNMENMIERLFKTKPQLPDEPGLLCFTYICIDNNTVTNEFLKYISNPSII